MTTLRIKDERLKHAIDRNTRALHEDYLNDIFEKNGLSKGTLVLPYGVKFNQEKKHVYLSLGDHSLIIAKGAEYDAFVAGVTGFYSERTGKSVSLDEALQIADLHEKQK